MTARAQYWLLRHPRVSRPLLLLGGLYVLAAAAVRTAPAASASTNAAVLNWTGLHDNYGVPIGDHYLSLAGFGDALTHGGPDASVWKPGTWWAWMMHALSAMSAANILTAEAGTFVGIIALSLWVMRLTISTYWLAVFGEIAKAVTVAVITVITRLGLVGITVPLGVFVGVLAIRRGEHGRGWTMILLAIMMPSLAVTVFSDPAGMMYGPNGLLAFGRRMGFSTAQAFTHNGAISGGGFTGQVDTLTSSLITHVVREPLEVFNFGHVVDHVGACGTRYSDALLRGASDGPVKAMARCGDQAAVHYAQNLDGTNVFIGLVLMVTAVLFGWFMISAGASVLMVSVKAMYTTAKLLPSVFAGGISGAAQEHAKATVWRFFKHPLEVMVFTTFVSVIGLAIERLISRPLPAELGGTSPFAHILIMGGASLAALYLLRHIRADLDGRHPGRGIVGRATDLALGMGMHATLGGAGSAALGGVRGLRHRLGAGKTPWERLDEEAATKPEDVLGLPQEGFDPVPTDVGGPPDEIPAAGETGPGPGGGGRPAVGAADTTVGGVDPLTATTRATAEGLRPAERAEGPGRAPAALRPTGGRATQPVLDLEPGVGDGAAAEVEPIAVSSAQREPAESRDPPPPAAYADHACTEVPLQPEPPPEDPGSPAATVDPVGEGRQR